MLDQLQNGFSSIYDLLNGGLSKNLPTSSSAVESSDAGVVSPETMKSQTQNRGMDNYVQDLLNNVGLDQLDLSSATNYSLQYAKVQFQINYQAVNSIQTANGVQTQQMNFSFNASFEYLSLQAGQGVTDPSSADGTQSADPLQSLMDYFSPESTAGRILDFALSFFPESSYAQEGGDTEDSRGKFADYIGNAVQKGFDQAMGILGKVPDKVQEDVDKTHEIVFKGFDDFVKNGLDKSKSGTDGVYANIQAYQTVLSLQAQYTKYDSSAYSGYNNRGQAISAQASSGAQNDKNDESNVAVVDNVA
ncbi:MAG: DUF5610 domain-containing protein [Planctomycetes bacterium]|nr:DUF5610 domain-containing protein [Planctomycetota bacterium]